MNALTAFEAAARLGGFTYAAAELSVAQPAITRHVAKLEDWVGAPLFNRRGNVITLTKQGEAMAALATSAFDRLEIGLRDIAPAQDRGMKLGASFGLAHLWLMPRISGLRAAASGAVNF